MLLTDQTHSNRTLDYDQSLSPQDYYTTSQYVQMWKKRNYHLIMRKPLFSYAFNGLRTVWTHSQKFLMINCSVAIHVNTTPPVIRTPLSLHSNKTPLFPTKVHYLGNELIRTQKVFENSNTYNAISNSLKFLLNIGVVFTWIQ